MREVVRVRSAAEMHAAVMARAGDADVVVMAAAVADYTPVERAPGRRSPKDGETLTLVLKKTPDILAELGQRRLATGGGPLLVGFAAETEDVVAHATAKRERKHVDLIVANDVSRADAGFDVDTNAVTIVGADGAETLPLQSKARVAARDPRSRRELLRRTSATSGVEAGPTSWTAISSPNICGSPPNSASPASAATPAWRTRAEPSVRRRSDLGVRPGSDRRCAGSADRGAADVLENCRRRAGRDPRPTSADCTRCKLHTLGRHAGRLRRRQSRTPI